jgi:acetyltransferase-like isoleucine patch superfamily enzyme
MGCCTRIHNPDRTAVLIGIGGGAWAAARGYIIQIVRIGGGAWAAARIAVTPQFSRLGSTKRSTDL